MYLKWLSDKIIRPGFQDDFLLQEAKAVLAKDLELHGKTAFSL